MPNRFKRFSVCVKEAAVDTPLTRISSLLCKRRMMSSHLLCRILLTELLLGSFHVVQPESTSMTPEGIASIDITPSENSVTATVASAASSAAFESGSSSSASRLDSLSQSSAVTASNQSTVMNAGVSSASSLSRGVESTKAPQFNTTVTPSSAGIHDYFSSTAAITSLSSSSSTNSLTSETTRHPVSSRDFISTTDVTVPTHSLQNDSDATTSVSPASPTATTFHSANSTVNTGATASSNGFQSTLSSAFNTTSSLDLKTNSSTTHSVVATGHSSAVTTSSSTSHKIVFENATTSEAHRTSESTSVPYSVSSSTTAAGSTAASASATATADKNTISRASVTSAVPTSNTLFDTSTAHSSAVNSSKPAGLAWVAAPVVVGVLLIAAVVLIVLLVLKQRRKKQRKSKFVGLERRQKQQVGGGGIMNPSFRIDTEDTERSPPAPVRVEDFVHHVSDLHRDSDYGFASEFAALNKMSPQNLKSAAEMPENRTKNRFTNVLPFDHSRVKLIPADDDENGGSDYINASFLPGFSSRREFIAAQGPMKSTVDDFWRMIWEYNVTTIVMVTNLFERGREKCVQYWPEQHEPIYYGDIQVEHKSESSLNYYTIRVFNVTLDKISRRVMHYQFLTWPDFGVPKEHSHLLSFLTQVRSSLHPTNNHPVLVHCSAGVGRTGTFILVDHVLQLIRRDSAIDMFGLVLDMRNHRPHMIQTEAQYIFALECIKYAIELGYHEGRDILAGSDDTSTGEAEGDSVYMNSAERNK